MIATKTLTEMMSAPATCELGFTGCEIVADEWGNHPTGEALGEDWGQVWSCGPCAYQAERES